MTDSKIYSDALRFLRLTVRNFLSFGPEETILDLSDSLLTAVIGINYDTGGDDSRNGTGKSALLIDAISYALFGETIRGVTKAHLVHKLARKGQPMVVTLEYQKGPFRYLIERQENPNKLLWFRKPIEDTRGWRAMETITENGKSTKRMIFDKTRTSLNTKEDIINSIGFDITLFSYLVGISSETTPFIRLREAERRDVIESLFGFKKLTLIAETLKKDRDDLKKSVLSLESGISATEAANARIQTQIDRLIQMQGTYYAPYETRKINSERRMNELVHQGKEICIEFYKNEFVKSLPDNITDKLSYVAELPDQSEALEEIETRLKHTETQLLLRESQIREQIVSRNRKLAEAHKADMDAAAFPSDKSKRLVAVQNSIPMNRSQHKLLLPVRDRAQKDLIELQEELLKLEQSECPACGQPLTEEHRNQEEARIHTEMESIAETTENSRSEIERLDHEYANLSQELERLTEEMNFHRKAEEKLSRANGEKLLAQMKENDILLKTDPDLKRWTEDYDRISTEMETAKKFEEARDAAIQLAQEFMTQNEETNRLTEIILEAKNGLDPKQNPNPYTEQIESLRTNALVNVEETRAQIVEQRSLISHHQLLIDLATKKDSFIRKKLIDRWLPYLNQRIADLLRELELPHTVKFDSEMDIHLSLYQSDYHNGSLSKGERTRLIVAITMAFQELYEQMNNRINLLIVDELIDNGICNRGAENAVRILSNAVRTHKKRAFVITHRSDIRDQVDSTLTVWKENDYSHVRWENQ